MADNFNMKQFLTENKLGPYSKLKEEHDPYDGGPEDLAAMARDAHRLRNNPTTIRIAKQAAKGATSKEEAAKVAVKPPRAEGIKDSEQITQIISLAAGMVTNFSEDLGQDRTDAEAEKMMDFLAEKDKTEEALSMQAADRMNGLVSQTALKALVSGTQTIIRDLKQDGFESDEIFEYIVSIIKDLDESKKPTEEALSQVTLPKNISATLGSNNPEGDKLVLRFLQGIAKKFDYPVAKAAMFVKERLKQLGY